MYSAAQSKERETKPRVVASNTSTADLFRLKGRTILITGGGGSMALEVASSILESGGDVICIDQAKSPLPEPWHRVQTIAEKHKTKISYYQCDITNRDIVNNVFDEAISISRYPFRGMMCCAGISGGGPAVDFSVEEFRRIHEVNVLGTFVCSQVAGREFKKQNQTGSVVLVASMSAHGSNKALDTAAYNSSKAAIVQLGRSLAAEWGATVGMPVVRVNTISPGYIKTRMTAKDLEDPTKEAEWAGHNMLNRLSEADEYRGPAMFLLSDASSFVTGADLSVDGGHTAW